MIGKRFAAAAGELSAAALLLPLIAALAVSGDYGRWWGSARGWEILGQTLAFSGLAAAAAVLGGVVLARAGWGWTVLGCAPLVLPSSLLGSAWIVALGRNGVLPSFFESLFLERLPELLLDLLPGAGGLSVFDWPVAAGVVGLRYVGLAGLVLGAQRRGQVVAARVYGVRRAWWWLGVRPMLGPLGLAWLVVTLWCAGEPILPSMFLVHTYATQVLIQYNALLDLPGAVALSTPMLAAGLGVVWWVKARLVAAQTQQRSEGFFGSVGGHGRWRWPLGAAGLLAVSLGLPLIFLVARAGSGSAVWQAGLEMRPELMMTLGLMAWTVPVCVLVGYAVAARWRASAAAGKVSLTPWVVWLLVVSPAVLALGWVELSGRWPLVAWRGWLDERAVVVGLAYVGRFAPLAAVVLWVSGLHRPGDERDAARALGVRGWRRWWGVDWPTQRRGLATAALLCGVMIATELELSLLLIPAGTSTAGVRLYTLIHSAPDQAVAASALAVLLALLPMAAALGGVMLWRRR